MKWRSHLPAWRMVDYSATTSANTSAASLEDNLEVSYKVSMYYIITLLDTNLTDLKLRSTQKLHMDVLL